MILLLNWSSIVFIRIYGRTRRSAVVLFALGSISRANLNTSAGSLAIQKVNMRLYNAYCSLWRVRGGGAPAHGSRAVQRAPITRVPRACVGAESQWILFIHNYLRIKSCFTFFRRPNLFSYLPILTRVLLRFIQSQVARTTCLTSFFIDAVQTLDDRGRGRVFISFTFWFSGPSDSLINSQIMRLNVSSPHLDWFRFFLFGFICVNAAAGSYRRGRDRIGTGYRNGPSFLLI